MKKIKILFTLIALATLCQAQTTVPYNKIAIPAGKYLVGDVNGRGSAGDVTVSGFQNYTDTINIDATVYRLKHVIDSLATAISGTYSLLGHTHSFASLTSKPTTIAGYGFTTDFNTQGDLRWSLLGHTHTSSSITDFNTAGDARWLLLSGGTLSGDVSQPNTPTNAFHLVNKNYVDNLITGITWKNAVRVATTANITLSGTQTIDGVSVIVGNRVLVKNQTSSQNNGIYLCAAGAWTRTTDCDDAAELESSTVFITAGTANKNTQWTESLAITTIGTDPVTFVQIAGAGTYTNGSGLDLTGNVFSVSTSGITNTMLAGSIANNKLANSSISGVSLGSNLFDLTIGTNLQLSSGTTFNGSAARTISLQNAAADGSTKGAASFNANDFDASSGNIAIDYTNGQAASASNKGFLPSADWTTFNNKEAAITASNTAKKWWNGFKQFVSANTDSINEGATNLFHTDARSRASISLTNTWNGSAPSYSSSTGVISMTSRDTILYITGGDQTTTSATAQNITGLVTGTLTANKRYHFAGMIFVGNNNTGGVKTGVTVPSGASVVEAITTRTTSATAPLFQSTSGGGLNATAFCTQATNPIQVYIEGEISVGATPGALQFTYASGTSTQTTTIYQLGSAIRVTQLN